MAIISASDYKTWKGISASTYDTLLATIIAGAQKRAERWCGRVFDSATFTEKLNGAASEILLVKNPPITSITSITDRDSGVFDSDDYTFDPDSGEIQLIADSTAEEVWGAPSFAAGFRNLTVVYVGAYGGSGAAIPADLTLAMLQYVDFIFAQVKDGALPDPTLKSESLGDYSYTRGDATEAGKIEIAMLTRLFAPFRRAMP